MIAGLLLGTFTPVTMNQISQVHLQIRALVLTFLKKRGLRNHLCFGLGFIARMIMSRFSLIISTRSMNSAPFTLKNGKRSIQEVTTQTVKKAQKKLSKMLI